MVIMWACCDNSATLRISGVSDVFSSKFIARSSDNTEDVLVFFSVFNNHENSLDGQGQKYDICILHDTC